LIDFLFLFVRKALLENAAKKEPVTFTDFLRARFRGILEPIARFLNKIGLLPNTVTLLGLLGTTIGSVFLAFGQLTVGGLIILVMAPIDALDGTMARLRGESSQFGGFVDSVTDRYAELVIFAGLLVHFIRGDNWWGIGLTYLAAAASVLVSYIRSRAEAAGYEAKIGIFSRVERYLVLLPCLIFQIPLVGVGAIALFGNITALQRILHVRREAYARMDVLRRR
jgi:CDP-diacylglycerol---glycerol-3-phosphate 3-phosphatidyltransferase